MSKNPNDLLSKLTGSTPEEEKKPETETTPASNSGISSLDSIPQSKPSHSGISSLDILGLPADQRKLINWLTRKKEATFGELQEGLGITTEKLNELIEALKASNYIYEALTDKHVYYRVVFHGSTRQKATGKMGELWARVDLDNVTFLKQLSIFQSLFAEDIEQISKLVTERQYARDEVVLWQGSASEYIYFIKSGVVGISRFSAENNEKKMLAYLKPGDIIGEYGVMLRQGGAATATATAMSAVTMLMIRKHEFLNVLNKYPAVTVEVVRILVQRLLLANDRSGGVAGAKLCVVVGVGSKVGCTTIGTTMAMPLAQVTQKTSVYTELPKPGALGTLFNIKETTEKYRHPSGYDMIVTHESQGVSPTVRTTLLLDRLLSQYENIIIGLPGDSTDILNYLTGYADQMIFVTTPEPERWEELNNLTASLKQYMHPEKTTAFTIINRPKPEQAELKVQAQVEYDIPYIESMPTWAEQTMDNRPAPIATATGQLADRLGRANQISVYIPTTIDVNSSADTTKYVERTLDFLGERFGGATTSKAHGVWNSADAGLVGEEIHIVRSYATQADLDKHLKAILDYVEQLKVELSQEAMAVEINQKLMLI